MNNLCLQLLKNCLMQFCSQSQNSSQMSPWQEGAQRFYMPQQPVNNYPEMNAYAIPQQVNSTPTYAVPSYGLSEPQVSVNMPMSQSQTSAMDLGATGGLLATSSSGENFNY